MPHCIHMPKPAFRLQDAIALLILSVASIIGINQYAYGLYNHCITIPFIKSLLNPALYGEDYLIAELKYFYSLFLPLCSTLIKLLKISLPVTFFTLYFISLYATLLAFFLLALKLFERRDVAYFSTMLLIFSITTLGQERTVENLLMERTFALPLLLFSFYFFLTKHYNTSAFLAGVAFLFHPLSASYVITMLLICMLYKVMKERDSRNLLIGAGILVAVASPIFFLKIKNPAPGLHLIHPSREWIDLLWLRSSHHLFPTTWGWSKMIESFALITAFLIAWKYKPRKEYHHIILISFLTILGLLVVGTIFTEIIPVSIIIQLQLFRSFKFLVYFTAIYYSNYVFTEPNTAAGMLRKLLLTALIAIPYLHENPTVLIGLLILILTVLPGLWLMEKAALQRRHYLTAAQLMLMLIMGVTGSLHHVHFSIGNSQESNWVSVQRWAKQNTPIDAAFIVPPYLEGFRVESERALYGEWKDGTQMFFDPLFGNEWIRRMKMAGYDERKPLRDSYNHLKEDDFEKIAAEMRTSHSKIYAVTTDSGRSLKFPQVFRNGKFSVYDVSVEVAKLHLVEDGTHELVAQSPEIGD